MAPVSVGRCGFCRESGASHKCAKCLSKFYCNKECEKKHYKKHRDYCFDFWLNKFKPKAVVSKLDIRIPGNVLSDMVGSQGKFY